MRERGGAGSGPPRRLFPWRGFVLAGGLALAAVAAVRAAAWLGDGGALRLPAAAAADSGVRRPTLVYAFHRADCRAHEPLRERWAALAGEGGARVVGVDLDRTGEDLPSPPFGFPVRPDRGGRVERLLLGLGYGRTPVTLVVDGAGRLRLAVAPSPAPGARRAAEAAVRAALGLGR